MLAPHRHLHSHHFPASFPPSSELGVLRPFPQLKKCWLREVAPQAQDHAASWGPRWAGGSVPSPTEWNSVHSSLHPHCVAARMQPLEGPPSASFPRRETPVAAETNRFAVPQQLTLGVALGGVTGRTKSSRSREEPGSGSVTQPFRSSG